MVALCLMKSTINISISNISYIFWTLLYSNIKKVLIMYTIKIYWHSHTFLKFKYFQAVTDH